MAKKSVHSEPSTTGRGRRAVITAFGPGKVILLGEHGVVYGHPALAAPLSFGVTAQATPAAQCELKMPARLSAQAKLLLQRAFDRAAEKTGHPLVQVKVDSKLPVSMGLGSSGALSVACARVLLGAAGKAAGPDAVAALAFEMEREFHGTPSGVDHTTSAQGQLLFYRRPVGSAEGLAEVVRARQPLRLLVAIAGKRGGTRATVAALRGRRDVWPERYGRTFEQIAALVVEARTAIEAGELEALGDCMNMNHGLLSALGLSSLRIESVVHAMREAGALGAKLTGAGGDGGACIGLFPDPARAARALRRRGLICFTSEVPASD